ncbi:MAG: hypothetical protein RJA81_446, partial [Planctomycetota bacterium]
LIFALVLRVDADFVHLLGAKTDLVTGPVTFGQDLPEDSESSLSPATKKFREMTKPEAKKKAQADLERPPFEFLRSQISPFDVLPYYKPNHWMYMTIEARSSREDFRGEIQTQPLQLFGSQHELTYERNVYLERNTPTRMSFPLFVPPRYMETRQSKVFDLDLYRELALRPTEIWKSNVRVMEPHQMAVLVLSRDPSMYTNWTKLMAGIPSSINRDSLSFERGRYFRFVLPENPEKPLLAPSFLFWTNISHVIWDGLDPNLIDVDQMRAMVDWIHWGGQLTIIGGADSRIGLLRESVLAQYIPADLGGSNRSLKTEDLKTLAESYRPPYRPTDSMSEEEQGLLTEEQKTLRAIRQELKPGPQSLYYDRPVPIVTPAQTGIFLTGLKPDAAATVIPFGDDQETPLAVEWRVGRGRVTVLAMNPTEPSLTRWRGMDTLVRRVILRRPEETAPPPRSLQNSTDRAPLLNGPDLTWLRIAARDVGGPYIIAPELRNQSFNPLTGTSIDLGENVYPKEEVTTWTDSAIIPVMAREQLELASGITIPPLSFVAKSLIVFLVLIVPVNWLVFRGLNRKELAWVFIPILSVVTAVMIERLAAYDLGFTRGRDEIAVLELQKDYPRGHLSRFGAMAATGRDQFEISFPRDLNAVCLPLAYSASRAAETETSAFQYTPMPRLKDFQVQPRSISYYRSEQMINLPGPIRMVEKDDVLWIENQTRLNLHDVVVIDPDGNRYSMGELGAETSRAVDEPSANADSQAAVSRTEKLGRLNPSRFLDVLADNPFRTPADENGWRLVGWSDVMIEGVDVQPVPDRVRGFTLVLVHLSSGTTPDPSLPLFDRTIARSANPTEVSDNSGLPANHPPIDPETRSRSRIKRKAVSARSLIEDSPVQETAHANDSVSNQPDADRSQP